MPEIIHMKKSEYDKMVAAELREKYLAELQEGSSSSEILRMTDSEILDMDYFLNEEKYDFDDEYEDCGKEPDVIYHIFDDTPKESWEDDLPY